MTDFFSCNYLRIYKSKDHISLKHNGDSKNNFQLLIRSLLKGLCVII